MTNTEKREREALTPRLVNGPVEWLRDALTVLSIARDENAGPNAKQPHFVVLNIAEYEDVQRLVMAAVDALPTLIDPDKLATWKTGQSGA